MELYGYTVVAVTFKTKEITVCGTYFLKEDAEQRRDELEAENYFPKAKIVVQGSEIWFPYNL
jgi:hypothetical protein